MPHKLITTLDLMRHGEPVGGRKYRGQQDDPLSEKGWAQMCQAVGDHCPWQAIVSSPLLRCADFARELAARHGLPLDMDDRLVELGFGAWEGRTADELTAEDPEVLVRFRRDPVAHAPPGAEPLARFRGRILEAWNTLLERHRGKQVLVIAHAGVIRMMVAQVLGIPLPYIFRLQVPSAGITRLRVESDGDDLFPQLLFHAGIL
ncbi:phosphoglycerate kinase [Sulfuricaulis limicola]|uniref:Phosphoglycerate kinase n=1 Tax=Sulfuricaulis limicola TaxID=1620215 RepID=A0A1B4XET8_9GAMM|nr:alpha-ribazole phosphatase family protein [Sulfuricaulis limicola]BAV33318.1 phosphoglycerate kinase [Sulfuricaulis limicola]